MSKNCYDKWWLRKDMENMGYIFEYCSKYCKNLYNIDIDRLKFLNTFMNSRFRYTMETGHERMLSQSAIDSIKMFVRVDCNGDIEQFKVSKASEDFEVQYAHNQLYWVGWMYAYLHFREDILSKDLIKLLPLELMLEHYYLGHEISKETYYEHIKHVFKHKKRGEKQRRCTIQKP